MKTLIIYDSFFGNTEKIATIIKEVLKEATLCKVNEVKMEQLKGIELLVVGSPTRGFRPSEGMQAFLKNIPSDSLKGVKIATFDTRILPQDITSPFARVLLSTLIKIFGYAASPIAKSLQSKGGEIVAASEGFVVKDSKGPLADGEENRAKEWAAKIIK